MYGEYEIIIISKRLNVIGKWIRLGEISFDDNFLSFSKFLRRSVTSVIDEIER